MNSFQEIVSLFHALLASEQGIGGQSSGAGPRMWTAEQLSMSQLPAPLLSQHGAARYPRAQVYCERIENQLKEKFNAFSGVVHLVIDLHVSHERWDGLAGEMEQLITNATRLIEVNRGELQTGVYMSGKYVVDLEAPKTGGRGYVQSARIKVPIEVVRA